MFSRRALLIINPVSGKRAVIRYIPDIIRALMDGGYLVTTAVTSRRGEAEELGVVSVLEERAISAVSARHSVGQGCGAGGGLRPSEGEALQLFGGVANQQIGLAGAAAQFGVGQRTGGGGELR